MIDGGDVWGRVHCRAAPWVYLEVQVGDERVPGTSHVADDVPGLHLGADFETLGVVVQVGVEIVRLVRGRQLEGVTSPRCMEVLLGDLAVAYGVQRLPERGDDVDPFVPAPTRPWSAPRIRVEAGPGYGEDVERSDTGGRISASGLAGLGALCGDGEDHRRQEGERE